MDEELKQVVREAVRDTLREILAEGIPPRTTRGRNFPFGRNLDEQLYRFQVLNMEFGSNISMMKGALKSSGCKYDAAKVDGIKDDVADLVSKA